MKKNKPKNKVLAKGIDSLYLYIEPQAIDLTSIIKTLESIDYNETVLIGGLPFTKVKAWVKMFSHCMRHGQFMFFVNKRALFVKVLSLAFEMRGFDFSVEWLCRILDTLSVRASSFPWMDKLKVTRLDLFTDFVFDDEFVINQFRTTLRKSGYFQSGKDADGKTLYFGSRAYFMVRLYVKSAEIKESGKEYLVPAWNAAGRDDGSRVWRLEFEFHKDTIRKVVQWNELSAIDERALASLWAFGIEAIEYCKRPAKNKNLSKMPLHPVWRELQEFHRAEYVVHRLQVKAADVEYRLKRARRWVISWLAARGLCFEDIPEHYKREFEISRADLEEARASLPYTFDDEMER